MVGTFLDLVEHSQIKEVNRVFKERLLKPESKYDKLVENEKEDLLFFPVSNYTKKGASDVQKVIEHQAREQFYVKKQISLRWMGCLDSLLAKGNVDPRPSWLKLNEVVSIAKELGIESVVEVEEMLNMFHQLGVKTKSTLLFHLYL